ncbi:ltrC-like protein [Photobacterium phosphoreum]|nr:ltrC-like protein [Photobacterium phosphoreum]
MNEALEIGRDQGYAKTKINIHLANGELFVHRHDIDADYPTLTIDLAHCSYKAIQTMVKPLFTYEQVKQALDAEYVSPLNHDGKQPEPTPTNDKNCRSVVSFGDYKDRIESKRDRLESRAEKATQQSNDYYKASKDRAHFIPFGQPILVGHHSENRARRDADRIYNDMGKSVAAGKKAEYLENKAANLGKNGIASDDPEAIQKLKSKLEALESAQEKMKAANKVIKSKHMTDNDKIEYLITTLNFTEKQAPVLLEGDFASCIGFSISALTSNNANIRQTKLRLEELEVMHNQEPLNDSGEVEGLSWSLYEEEGRIKFSFDGKPSEAVRNVLKSNGFKWSRYSMAWVRKITANAVFSTKRMIPDLK